MRNRLGSGSFGILCAGLTLAGLMPSGMALAEDVDTGGAAATIEMQKRRPLGWIYVAPSGEKSKTRRADIIAEFDVLLGQHTDLERQEVKDYESCQGELHCFVLRARSDYDYQSMRDPTGKLTPYRDHLAKLDEKKQPRIRYVVVLSNITSEGGDRLSALILDTDAALEIYHSASREKEFWKEDVEARVSSDAVVGRAAERTMQSRADIIEFAEQAVTKDFRAAFERGGNWEPFGVIELVTEHSGLEIGIDGEVIGTTRSGLTRIAQVPQGAHVLSLTSPEFEPYESDIQVERKDTVRLVPQLSGGEGLGIARQSVFWAGVVTAAAGIGVTVWGATQGSGDLTVYCLGQSPDVACGQPQFAKSGYRSDVYGSTDPNKDGVPIAPIGYSMIGTGATWSLGTLLFTEGDDFPWIPLVAGLAVFGLTLGISVAADGGSAFPPEM